MFFKSFLNRRPPKKNRRPPFLFISIIGGRHSQFFSPKFAAAILFLNCHLSLDYCNESYSAGQLMQYYYEIRPKMEYEEIRLVINNHHNIQLSWNNNGILILNF